MYDKNDDYKDRLSPSDLKCIHKKVAIIFDRRPLFMYVRDFCSPFTKAVLLHYLTYSKTEIEEGPGREWQMKNLNTPITIDCIS